MPRIKRATTAKPSLIERYGCGWPAGTDPLEIELACIRQGGKWKDAANGRECGAGLFCHYRAAQSLLWPREDHHRWSDLILRTILDNVATVVMGPKNSTKTHTCAKYGLVDFFAFPGKTMILVSSTDLRGLELRVWGDMKSLMQEAKQRYEWLPGQVLDSKHAISAEDIDEDGFRDLRNGIICVPCVSSSGTYVGLGKYVGSKNERVRLIGDESQFMKASFLDAPANLSGNPDFKVILLGNPIDPMDPLGKAGEPMEGWSSFPEPEKTLTWRNRFFNGVTINLVGTDSPNYDFPQDKPPRYPYLIHQAKIQPVIEFYGKDSLQFYSQCKGVLKAGLISRRVITRELCRQFGALEKDVFWAGKTTKIYAVDAAYGNIGGDRCVGGMIEFGRETGGNGQIIRCHPPVVVPVSVKLEQIPEDQIAEFVRRECERLGIPPQNVFYDATGRGSLGTAFARLWSPLVNPVEFGGTPTPRPVSADLFMYDPKTRERRLKRCDEHYSKRVTEFWFSVRYAIEGRQMRGLDEETMDEGCMREWMLVRGDKIEVEPKADTKERMGRSPDRFDWLVTAVEGARQRGFVIRKMGTATESSNRVEWIEDMMRKRESLRRSHSLVYR